MNIVHIIKTFMEDVPLKINKKHLLLLAGIIWAIAGFNILRIGILSYRGNVTLLNLFLSCVIFTAFWFLVFDKLVRKHTFRILNYQEEKQFFLKFFDIKSFCIMAFMMTFGIGLRVSHGCVRLRNEDIKFLFEKVPVGTRVQFIDEPVKATTEPDGSRYIEVHNPLSTTEAQFEGQEIVPITLTKSVQTVTGQPDVDQVVLDEAIKNRSGMPVRLN